LFKSNFHPSPFLDHIQLSVNEYREKLYDIIATRRVNIRRIQYSKLSTVTSMENNVPPQQQHQINNGASKAKTADDTAAKIHWTDEQQNHNHQQERRGSNSLQMQQKPRPTTSHPNQKQQQIDAKKSRPETGYTHAYNSSSNSGEPDNRKNRQLKNAKNLIVQNGKKNGIDGRNYKQEFGSTNSIERKEGHVAR